VGDKVAGVADAVAGGAVDSFAQALLDGLVSILTMTLSWWVSEDSPRLSDRVGTINDIRGWVLPVAIVVAVGGAMWQGIRMMLMRKSEPLIDIGRGLMLIAVWSAIGIAAPNLALQAGDSFSKWVINESTGGDFKEAILRAFSNPAKGSGTTGVIIVLGVLAIIAATIQAFLLLFREGAVVLLAGLIVLAAAGSFTSATSGWLRKVTAWMSALVFYKPVAALVYAATFSLIKNAHDVQAMITAMGMLILSIAALPALMRLFDWSIGSLQSGGSGLGASASVTGGGVRMAKRLQSGPGSASDQARFITQSLGPAAGPPKVAQAGGASSAVARAPTGAMVSAASSGGGVGGTAGTAGAAAGAGAVGAASIAGPAVMAVAVGAQAAVAGVKKVAELGAAAIEEPRRGS